MPANQNCRGRTKGELKLFPRLPRRRRGGPVTRDIMILVTSISPAASDSPGASRPGAPAGPTRRRARRRAGGAIGVCQHRGCQCYADDHDLPAAASLSPSLRLPGLSDSRSRRPGRRRAGPASLRSRSHESGPYSLSKSRPAAGAAGAHQLERRGPAPGPWPGAGPGGASLRHRYRAVGGRDTQPVSRSLTVTAADSEGLVTLKAHYPPRRPPGPLTRD